MLWFECCDRSFRERRHYHLAIGFRVSRYKRLSSFVPCNASNYSLTGLRCAIPTGQCRSYSSMMYKLATSHSLVPSVVHGLCYNDGLNTDAVITTGGDYGAVLAPYDIHRIRPYVSPSFLRTRTTVLHRMSCGLALWYHMSTDSLTTGPSSRVEKCAPGHTTHSATHTCRVHTTCYSKQHTYTQHMHRTQMICTSYHHQ